MLSPERLAEIKADSFIQSVTNLNPVTWLNPFRKNFKDLPPLELSKQDMDEGVLLLERFAPYLKKVFPETASSNGKITSPLKEVPKMKEFLSKAAFEIKGRMFIKCDSDLAVTGSIKARGGFFEILSFAEKLAVQNDLISEDLNYEQFDSEPFHQLFRKYKITVASTGNLGLSIGMLSSRLGFKVEVYMSDDARQWKKDLLRSKGATVLEFDGTFTDAVNEARKASEGVPDCFFVDDENSRQLYLGYSLGALELQKNLAEKEIVIDENHPLFVYSPCGVGGSPGGTAFGLKEIYGDAVHCFFVEPTHAPSALLGIITGEMSNIAVEDLGIVNRTEADGLAVGRASRFATQISSMLISGIYTVEDELLFWLLANLWDTEQIFLEPSATPGLIGPQRIATTDYISSLGINPENITHIVWATGGSLVPQHEREEFYNRGKR